MPQIGNQDYITIFGDRNSNRFKSQLAYAIERGTIYDVVCGYVDGANKHDFRVLAITIDEEGNKFLRYITHNNAVTAVIVSKTGDQYKVMADMDDVGADPTTLSALENGYLIAVSAGDTDTFICVDGKYIAATLDDDDCIASYVVTDVEAVGVDVANIPVEDLPGLIGLYAGN